MSKIIHVSTGIVVENYVSKNKINKTLNYWRNNGMSGTYKAIGHTALELMNRIW